MKPNFLSLSDLAFLFLFRTHFTHLYVLPLPTLFRVYYPPKSCQKTPENPAAASSAGNSRFIVNLSSVIADSECHQRFENCHALSINACVLFHVQTTKLQSVIPLTHKNQCLKIVQKVAINNNAREAKRYLNTFSIQRMS